MKRLWKACLCVAWAMLLVLQCAVPAGATEQQDISVTSGCWSVDAAKALEANLRVAETAKGVVVYERNSGTMVYSWNADGRIFPASMVKLMTALVALDQTNLSTKVQITQKALSNVPPSALVMGLRAGEVMTLEQLLYCMMVASSNDAAVVIAQHVAGSQEAFIARMNEKARELGCTGTNFSNVHGLHSEQTYTTTRDVCRVLLAGLEDPRFREMFGAVSYVIPATNLSPERKIRTTNNMMLSSSGYYDERVTGGRTGATDAAGRCIAITVEAKGMELVCVLMGAEPVYSEDGQKIVRFGSYEEMEALLRYIFNGYEIHQLAAVGQIVTQMEVVNGANHVAVQPVQTLMTVLPVDMDHRTLRWEFEGGALTAPVTAGQAAGAARVWYNELCLGQTQLITANDVAVEKELVMVQRPSETDGRGSWTVLLIAVAVILLGASLATVISTLPKLLRKLKVKRMRRRRRQNRRRTRG